MDALKLRRATPCAHQLCQNYARAVSNGFTSEACHTRVQIPSYFALILRAFSVIEGIALRVDPDYSIVQEVRTL